jgi:hypothetical protein
MPWLLMYLLDEDVTELCSMLNADPEVALIRPDGSKRWKADPHIPALPDGGYVLWHIPSGPIMLEPRKPKGRVKRIKDPFTGWAEIAQPSEPGVPWISAAPLGNIWLTIRRSAGTANQTFRPTSMARPWTARASEVIGRSEFHWIGNYYSVIGERAPRVTEEWWKSLRKRIAKVATQIPTTGPITRKPKEVWAFPQALEKIHGGMRRADNPL